MPKKILVIIILILIILGFVYWFVANNNKEENVGIANPASVYCVDQGGRLEIRTNQDGSQAGVCVFTDGSECDEWAFFRKECAMGNR